MPLRYIYNNWWLRRQNINEDYDGLPLYHPRKICVTGIKSSKSTSTLLLTSTKMKGAEKLVKICKKVRGHWSAKWLTDYSGLRCLWLVSTNIINILCFVDDIVNFSIFLWFGHTKNWC
jgi:hypothetical protein